jgi:hypothetical protein
MLWKGRAVGGRHAGDIYTIATRPSVRSFFAGMARFAALEFSAKNIPHGGPGTFAPIWCAPLTARTNVVQNTPRQEQENA